MITDARGRKFRFSHSPERVVSLVPSLTEILFDLDAGDSVVGVTGYCIFPDAALNQATPVGGTKNPQVETIRTLSPDLVYMNLEENLPRHAELIEEFAPVFATHPTGVDDTIELMRQLGEIHLRHDAAEELIERLEQERRFLSQVKRPFSFAVPIWKKPWMWCGGDTYVSRLVEEAGGRNLCADELRYPSIPLQELAAREPEVIFLPDEPYLFTEAEAAELRQEVAAEIVGPFPGHLFTWHGSRTIQGLRFLRQWLSAG
jgi:ABC-type Fe3+-hydroxamate transport system substrate-binding protein